MSTTGVDTVVPGRPEDGVPPGLVALEEANDRKRALLAELQRLAMVERARDWRERGEDHRELREDRRELREDRLQGR